MFIYRESYYLERLEPIRKSEEDDMKYNERVSRWQQLTNENYNKAEIIRLSSRNATPLNGHTNYVQGVAWDPCNKMVVTQSSDRTCRVHAVSVVLLLHFYSCAYFSLFYFIVVVFTYLNVLLLDAISCSLTPWKLNSFKTSFVTEFFQSPCVMPFLMRKHKKSEN